jgi:branched-chain amino acid aminotransferase
MNDPIFYVNGRFLQESTAFVKVSDIGLLRGYGVFDFTITYDRKPFRLNDHLKRLVKSAQIIGLDLPWNIEELTQIIYTTLEKNPQGEKSIRIIVTGGDSADSFTPADMPSLIVMVKPIKVYPKEYFTKGVKVITFKGKREIPEAKTLNYAHAIRALRQARQQMAEEALYTDNDTVYECMACSFFAVKDNKIITAGNDVLDGITRRTVLEVIKGKIPVEYRFVKLSEIPSLDETFLTSSNHEVMPINTIDSIQIGDGTSGTITREVMRLFGEYTGKKLV